MANPEDDLVQKGVMFELPEIAAAHEHEDDEEEWDEQMDEYVQQVTKSHERTLRRQGQVKSRAQQTRSSKSKPTSAATSNTIPFRAD
eukprot:6476533-Amphidinium_carterae.2